jgi:hypothetical protein
MKVLTKEDVRGFKESARRQLYDMLAESIFGTPENEEDIRIKDFEPDDIQLEVVWWHGRWFGKWTWPTFKSKRIRGENRRNLVRLYLDKDGKLMQDEV